MGISIVGLGVGNLDYMVPLSKKKIISADIIIGGYRQLESIKSLVTIQKTYKLENLEDMKLHVKKNINKKICFVVSGDTGFYSLLSYLKKYFSKNINCIVPGISSFQYLFSKIGETWEEYSLFSMHGRELNFINELKKSTKGIILLTDKENSPNYIGKILFEKNFFNIEMIIGENLSYVNEKIYKFKVKNYKKEIRNYGINVVILKKE